MAGWATEPVWTLQRTQKSLAPAENWKAARSVVTVWTRRYQLPLISNCLVFSLPEYFCYSCQERRFWCFMFKAVELESNFDGGTGEMVWLVQRSFQTCHRTLWCRELYCVATWRMVHIRPPLCRHWRKLRTFVARFVYRRRKNRCEVSFQEETACPTSASRLPAKCFLRGRKRGK